MIKLASYSYMSGSNFFKLRNHNPKFKFKFVTTRKCKGVKASSERVQLCFDKLCFCPLYLVKKVNKNWNSFKKFDF